jgi:cytochrome c-type biogenesis protein CcmE
MSLIFRIGTSLLPMRKRLNTGLVELILSTRMGNLSLSNLIQKLQYLIKSGKLFGVKKKNLALEQIIRMMRYGKTTRFGLMITNGVVKE